MRRLAILVGLALASAPAHADDVPSTFELIDRGTAVEVIAHNVTAARTGVLPVRSRLEVPLAGHPRAIALTPKDATVKIVELEDGNLSVKTGYEHPSVIGLAKFAQARQVGPDVHLIFPRIVPPDGAAVVMPEPTIPAPLAQEIAKPAPVAPAPVVLGPPPPPPPLSATPAPKVAVEAPKSEAPKARAPEVAAASTKQTPDVAKPAPAMAKAPTPEDAWQKLGLYGAIGLAGVGCGAYLLKKRRGAQGPAATIELIAQRSLGGKARVVWFAAGGHEMVVAVTPQSVRMLGQWPATARPPGMLPMAHTVAPEPRPAASSAVSGILKLREKAGPAFAHLGDDVTTEDVDADALWAKEILAATGAKR
jgi:flagellar biogenesis protein FliO